MTKDLSPPNEAIEKLLRDRTADYAAQAGTAINLKRYVRRELTPREWFSQKAEDPYWILDTVEFKTAWHPIGL